MENTGLDIKMENDDCLFAFLSECYKVSTCKRIQKFPYHCPLV